MPSTYPQQRQIGDDLVSAQGLGCMGMSAFYSSNGGFSVEESLGVLTKAADLGITFWDTSDIYGPFTNEELIGEWFRKTGRRREIFLATKFGLIMEDGKLSTRGDEEYVKQACDASLKRLGVSQIDLYYQHRVDPKTPTETTVKAMAELKKEGKIRYLGLSECSARTLRRAYAVHPIAAAQMEYSPFATEIENEQTNFLATARELGVAIVAYSPLGRGFLSGAIKSIDDLDEKDSRRAHPRFQAEHFTGNLKLVHTLESIARRRGCTPSQLTLAWVLAQGDDFIPIPGTKRIKYLMENRDAANITLDERGETATFLAPTQQQLANLHHPTTYSGNKHPIWQLRTTPQAQYKMKAGLLAIVAFSAAVSAQPHRRHLQLHEQRDVVVETVYQTQVEYATATAPAAIVYVDGNGNPISQAESTPEPAPVAPVVNINAARPVDNGNGRPGFRPDAETTTTAAPQAPAYTPSPEPVPAPAPVVSAAPEVASAPAPAAPSAVAEQPYSAPAAQPSAVTPSTGGSGLGITYSPYNADGTCKSTSQVKTDIDTLTGYSLIRLYGTDCNQVANVLAPAKAHGIKLFLGVFNINDVAGEVAKIVTAVGGDWSIVDTVSVGNEGVNAGTYSVAAVGAAVAATKAALTVAGYSGPVVTVDTFIAIINNPGLCDVGDYVAANCHAFFDGAITADKAGEFVLSQTQRVSKACGGKKTVITESGWPSQGSANQKAVPGTAEQAAAVQSLKSSFSSNLILFNAFNDGWKKDTADTFGAEKYWGIYGVHPSGY